jgi:hypothetical protein
LDIVAHPCNPTTAVSEARGLQVLGQPGLYSKTLSQKEKKKKKEEEEKFLYRLHIENIIFGTEWVEYNLIRFNFTYLFLHSDPQIVH